MQRNKTLFGKARFRVDRWLKSIRVAVGVLAFIALASSVGTLIPQERASAFYLERFGPALGKVLLLSGLDDLFHAPWFMALLAWVLVSMVVCSLSHLKFLRQEGPRTPEEVDPGRFDVIRAALDGSGPSRNGEAPDRIASWLKGRLYRVTSRPEIGGGRLLAAEKGGIGRFGPFTIHWGCIVVLAGGLASTVFGTDGKIALAEGEAAAVPGAPFRLTLEEFAIEKYEGTEHDKGYLSRVRIEDVGGASNRGEIRVNEPLIHRGWRLYQMDFRSAVREVRVRLQPAPGRGPAREFDLLVGEPLAAPDMGLTLFADAFQPDFVFQDGKASSRSEEFKNPALRLSLADAKGVRGSQWVFPDMAGSFHRGPVPLPYRARLVSFVPRYAIGLKFVKDPARPVVYLGFVIAIIGTFLSSAVFHRRVFVRFPAAGRDGPAELTGAARRNRIGFEREIAELRAFAAGLAGEG